MSFEDQFGRNSRGGGMNGRPAQNVNQPNSYNSLPMRNYNQSGYTNQPRSSANNLGGYQTSSYDRLAKTCSDNVQQLSSNVGRIKTLTETLGTSKDSLSNREQLRHLIDGTRLIANDTSQSLKHLHDSVQEAAGTLDEKSRRVQYNKLLKDFQAWLGKFQEISKIAADKERTAPAPAPPPQKSKSNSTSYYEEDRDDDVKQGLLAAQKAQQMQFDNEQNYMDAIIADRDASIREIERSVRDVNEIFQDLAHLVNEQGQMIDHIESNIDESVSRVEEGVVELRKANEYQKKSRNKMCCLALILLIVCGIVVLVVYLLLGK